MLGELAIAKLLKDYEFQTVLDVGCGPGHAAERFRAAGKQVVTIDNSPRFKPDLQFVYPNARHPAQYDCVWCCHVLEHQRNPGIFIDALIGNTKSGGILAITVPPYHTRVVDGHITAWNAGILLYQLVAAGLDCRDAAVHSDGDDVSVIVRRKENDLIPGSVAPDFAVGLRWTPPDCGLGPYLGEIKELNW